MNYLNVLVVAIRVPTLLHHDDRHVRIVLSYLGDDAVDDSSFQRIADEHGSEAAVPDPGPPVTRLRHPHLGHVHELDHRLELLGPFRLLVDDQDQQGTGHQAMPSRFTAAPLPAAQPACPALWNGILLARPTPSRRAVHSLRRGSRVRCEPAALSAGALSLKTDCFTLCQRARPGVAAFARVRSRSQG